MEHMGENNASYLCDSLDAWTKHCIRSTSATCCAPTSWSQTVHQRCLSFLKNPSRPKGSILWALDGLCQHELNMTMKWVMGSGEKAKLVISSDFSHVKSIIKLFKSAGINSDITTRLMQEIKTEHYNKLKTYHCYHDVEFRFPALHTLKEELAPYVRHQRQLKAGRKPTINMLLPMFFHCCCQFLLKCCGARWLILTNGCLRKWRKEKWKMARWQSGSQIILPPSWLLTSAVRLRFISLAYQRFPRPIGATRSHPPFQTLHPSQCSSAS